MYNITVDEAHTYFVGNEQWLVHNVCGFSNITRVDARRIIRGGVDDHSNAQANKALKHLGRGKVDRVAFNVLENGNAELKMMKKFDDGGYSEITNILNPDGTTLSSINRIYNELGELISTSSYH
jgi:hypothetical protein